MPVDSGRKKMEVWVTGLGCVCAAGRTVAETWDSLIGGTGRNPAPPARLLKLAADLGINDDMAQPVFMVDDDIFAGGFRHSARDTLILAETAAGEALTQAGLNRWQLADGQSGVVIGSTAGNALHFLADYAALKKGHATAGTDFADFFHCNPAEAMAKNWNINGPALTVGNACCSGTDAVGLGLEIIASGRCRRVLAGGADALSLVPYAGFRRLMIYADESCRPFDRSRQGLNLGEGAGILLLESAEAAEERGVEPLARFLSYGAASDAHHLTAPHPEAAGLRKALRTALARAGLAAADLAFVNAHGTATPDNDRMEALAYREELPGTPVWAVKGSTGHTLGAAGGLEAVLTVRALQHGLLPKSHGFAEADPALDMQPTTATAMINGRAAASVSLGFGGGNAALVFGRL